MFMEVNSISRWETWRLNKTNILTLRWHFDFYIVKIGMPQKGLKKEDGVRGRREKLLRKVFPFFPDLKSTIIGNRAN